MPATINLSFSFGVTFVIAHIRRASREARETRTTRCQTNSSEEVTHSVRRKGVGHENDAIANVGIAAGWRVVDGDGNNPAAGRRVFGGRSVPVRSDVVAVGAGSGIPLMERQGVCAFGQINADRIIRAFASIIFRKFRPQPASLDAHHRIHGWIKIRRPAELFGGDLVFLERCSRMFQCVVSEITQELAQGLRTMQNMALGKTFYLPQILLPF